MVIGGLIFKAVGEGYETVPPGMHLQKEGDTWEAVVDGASCTRADPDDAVEAMKSKIKRAHNVVVMASYKPPSPGGIR